MVTVTDKANIESLTATWEPRMRAAFLQAVASITTTVDIVALTHLIEAGDVLGAMAAVGADTAHFSALALTQTSMFNEGGMALARATSRATFQLLFDVRATRAEQWIKQRSSTLIQDITADQRTTIRNHLEAGLQAGTNPRTVALDLVGRVDPRTKQRVGGVIGLHSTQEEWLRTYSADLASSEPARFKALLQRGLRDNRFDATVLKAIRDGTAIPPELQAKMRVAYSNNALKWRADNIARNETVKSLSAAKTEMWQQNIDRGKIDAKLITRFPVTAGDERVRHTHREVPAMNKDGRGWGEPFETPFGPQMHAPYESEVGCRCYENIRVDFLAMAIAKKKARDSGQ